MNIVIRKYYARGTCTDAWLKAQHKTWRVIVDGCLKFSGIATKKAAEDIAANYRAEMTVLCGNCGQNVIGRSLGMAYVNNKPALLCPCGQWVSK
jgi:hypothetical protein